MRSLGHAFFLAMSDYWHERLLSACAILGLAAVLTPLMVLLGVHHGIITAMTERLLNDPRTLEVTPVGSGKYGPGWFKELAALPGVAFVAPQTRSIAATMTLRHAQDGQQNSGGSGMLAPQAVVPLAATGPGDPLLLRWNQPQAGWQREPARSAAAAPATAKAPSTAAIPPTAVPSAVSAPASENSSRLGSTDNAQSLLLGRVLLSASTARKLNAKSGSRLEGRVDRVRAGKRESAIVPLLVVSVLPPEAQATDLMFVPLELLVATEDYRDGRAVPFLGWTGDAPTLHIPAAPATSSPAAQGLASSAAQGVVAPATGSAVSPAAAAALPPDSPEAYAEQIRRTREFASFRLYAKNLEGVGALWRWFQERRIEVYVKAAEIDTVKSLDRAFSIVFGLITGAAVFGFTASTASSALAGVRRKSRSIGLMRLMGFRRLGILLFPVAQTMATGFFGFLLASALYLGVAFSIDGLFAASLPGGEAVCSLPFLYLAAVFGVVLLLSGLASFAAAWQATTIEPSEVIRDV